MIAAIPDDAPIQAVIEKVNELIKMANDLLEMKDVISGTGVVTQDNSGHGCCTEEDDHEKSND